MLTWLYRLKADFIQPGSEDLVRSQARQSQEESASLESSADQPQRAAVSALNPESKFLQVWKRPTPPLFLCFPEAPAVGYKVMDIPCAHKLYTLRVGIKQFIILIYTSTVEV